MKTLINLFALAVLVSAGAKADIIISLDNPNQTGNPGAILNFFGTITNNDPNSDDAPIYLNGDPWVLLPDDASFEDNFFAAYFPVFLPPGASSGDIDLFDVALANPEADSFGLYTGSSYGLVGGADGGAQTASDNLAQASFSIDVEPASSPTPEPGTLWLLLPAAMVPVWRRARK